MRKEDPEKKTGCTEELADLGVAAVSTGALFLKYGLMAADPHRFDRISPLIENHFGNVPLSMVWTQILMWGWPKLRSKIDSEILIKWGDFVDAAAPVLVVGVIGGLNLITEMAVPNNYELKGDVAAGIIGSAVAATRYLVPAVIKLFKSKDERRFAGSSEVV